jgi:hypothetical protein
MITKTGVLKSDIYKYTGNRLGKFFSSKELQSNCTIAFSAGTSLYFIKNDLVLTDGWYFEKDNDRVFYSKETTDEIIDIEDIKLIKLVPGYNFFYADLYFTYKGGNNSYWIADTGGFKITIEITDLGLVKINHVLKIKPEHFII